MLQNWTSLFFTMDFTI